MKAATNGKPITDFPRPEGINEVAIDPLTGLLARFEQPDARTEVFVRGTEPTEVAPPPSAEPTEVEPLSTPTEGIPSEVSEPDGPDEAPTAPAPKDEDTRDADDATEPEVSRVKKDPH
jgi:membrane carboxypeptidase/penicillin-binding protein